MKMLTTLVGGDLVPYRTHLRLDDAVRYCLANVVSSHSGIIYRCESVKAVDAHLERLTTRLKQYRVSPFPSLIPNVERDIDALLARRSYLLLMEGGD